MPRRISSSIQTLNCCWRPSSEMKLTEWPLKASESLFYRCFRFCSRAKILSLFCKSSWSWSKKSLSWFILFSLNYFLSTFRTDCKEILTELIFFMSWSSLIEWLLQIWTVSSMHCYEDTTTLCILVFISLNFSILVISWLF